MHCYSRVVGSVYLRAERVGEVPVNRTIFSVNAIRFVNEQPVGVIPPMSEIFSILPCVWALMPEIAQRFPEPIYVSFGNCGKV